MGSDCQLSHEPDMILDLGPPQSFWCFAYERMNGFLAGTPNGNRKIKVDVLDRFIRDASFSNCDLPAITQNIPHIMRNFVTPYVLTDNQPPSYPRTFWVLSILDSSDNNFETQLSLDRGEVDNWPIHLKHPSKLNVVVKPTFQAELSTFFDGLYGSDLEYVQPRINKYGRCEVNGITFSSIFNSTDRGSIVKCMFVDDQNELAPYFGIVRFYFTVNTVTNQETITHHLAYVTWLKFKSILPGQYSM